MPSRWWIPIAGIDPDHVRVEHVHAAVSAWFDKTTAEHRESPKPYAISPLAQGSRAGEYGCEVGILTARAAARLKDAVDGTPRIRLGRATGRVNGIELIHETTWDELAIASGSREWSLTFATPATFRQRSRSTPLPHPASILHGLATTWEAFSDLEPRTVPRENADRIWIADLQGSSQPVRVSQMNLSGFVGTVVIRCDDAKLSSIIDPLFRLAEYSGVGTARAKGLGVTYVEVRPP